MKYKSFFVIFFVSALTYLYGIEGENFLSDRENQKDGYDEIFEQGFDFEEDEEYTEEDDYEKSTEEKIFFNGMSAGGFFIEQKLRLPKTGRLSAGFNAAAYSGFMSFETDFTESFFKREIYSAGFRFTPLFYFSKTEKTKKLEPAFSIYAGAVKDAYIFTRISKPSFTSIRPSHRMTVFPQVNLLNISHGRKKFGAAAEFALPFFNFSFLFRQDKSEKGGEFKLHTSFSKRDFSNPFTKLNLSFVSLFFPKASTKKEAEKERRYMQIYGAEMNFINSFLSFSALFAVNYFPSAPVSCAFRSEAVLHYDWSGFDLGFNFGGSYRGENYKGSRTVKQKEFFFFFARPFFSFGIFKTALSYSVSKIYNGGKLYHSYGADIFTIHKYAVHKMKFFYRNDLYELYSEVKLQNFTEYFAFFKIRGGINLQERNINPFCVKSYSAGTEIQFNIMEKAKLGFEFGVLQKNKIQKRRNKVPIIEWQKEELWAAVYSGFVIKNINTKHGGGIYLKVKNIKPFFEAVGSYKISF